MCLYFAWQFVFRSQSRKSKLMTGMLSKNQIIWSIEGFVWNVTLSSHTIFVLVRKIWWASLVACSMHWNLAWLHRLVQGQMDSLYARRHHHQSGLGHPHHPLPPLWHPCWRWGSSCSTFSEPCLPQVCRACLLTWLSSVLCHRLVLSYSSWFVVTDWSLNIQTVSQVFFFFFEGGRG